MRLPESIYESLPYAYVIAGTLFNVGIIYMGPNAPWALNPVPEQNQMNK